MCVATTDVNVCGRDGLPYSGDFTDPLVIRSLSIHPQGAGAYAPEGWNNNRFTWRGSKYFVYAKLADCDTGGKHISDKK